MNCAHLDLPNLSARQSDAAQIGETRRRKAHATRRGTLAPDLFSRRHVGRKLHRSQPSHEGSMEFFRMLVVNPSPSWLHSLQKYATSMLRNGRARLSLRCVSQQRVGFVD